MTKMLGMLLVVALAMALIMTTNVLAAGDYSITKPGDYCDINGARFEEWGITQAAGTGVYDTFLKVGSNNDATKGYNSDFSGDAKVGSPEYDEGVSWTHSKLTVDVPLVDPDSIAGIDRYREFQLDINQSGNGEAHYITLDNVVLYLTNNEPDADGFYSGYKHALGQFTLANGFKQIYDMDAGGDSTILINFEINAGSGKRDVIMWVPDSADWYTYKYVILYTEHGADIYSGLVYEYDNGTKDWELRSWPDQAYPNNDGFEEWGVALYDATKTGYKWNDLSADGIWDGGEPGLAGWTIWIDDGDGVLEAGEPFAVTASDGSYTITDIEPGTYDVRELPPAGETDWICSYPSGGFYDDEVFGNGGYNINNFGNYQQGTKEGTKYEDFNADGEMNGSDAGLSGWTIAAFSDEDASNTLTAGDILADSDVTDGNGDYTLTLDPGTYIVVEQVSDQTGWFESPDSGTSSVNTYDADYGEYGYVVTITSGSSETGNDFANYQMATKGGCKYEDMDGDGDISEDTAHPLSGWEIKIVGTAGDGSPVDLTTTTNSSGCYEFTVKPGVYTVSETLKAGWIQTYPDIPGDGDWDVTLTSGQEDLDNNFGNFESLNVTACKKSDADGDLSTTDDQTILVGWPVYLTINGTQEDAQVTGADGCYTWTNLGPQPGGYYDVEEHLADFPAGWYNLTPLSHDFESPPRSGASYNFTFVNTQPGGEPRTPGYWKNWNKCDGKGNQVDTAARNGGWEAGFWLIEDIIGPYPTATNNSAAAPIWIGDLEVDTCEEAVAILDMRALNNDKKKGGDAAYMLARNLLAAYLNYGAGACMHPDVTQTMADAQALLDSANFNGTGNHWKGGKNAAADRATALVYANILDEYNNGMYCP